MVLRKTRFACILVAALPLFVSCGGNEKGDERSSPKGEAGLAANGADSTVVITVNGNPITRADVEVEVSRLFRQFGGKASPAQAEQMKPMLHENAKDNLVKKALLLEEASRREIEIPSGNLDERIADYKSNFPDEETFRKNLAGFCLTEEGFRKEMRDECVIGELVSQVVTDLAGVTEDMVTDRYRQNPAKYQKPEEVRASHILLTVKPDESPEARDEKRAKIADLRQQVLDGADFAEVAREHSDCKSSVMGGDLGWFGRNRMVKPFEEAAFALGVGEVSEVVETQFGYHVIKVTDRHESRNLAFDEAKGMVRQELIDLKLTREGKKKAIDDFLLGLREGAKIVVLEPAEKIGQPGPGQP